MQNRLDKILKTFTKTITKLNKVSEDAKFEREANSAQVVHLSEKNAVLYKVSERADRVKDKLSELLL